MCQPTSQPQQLSCPTIKANARLRRSRQWKDENNANAGNAAASPKTTPTKKNPRRRRRPTKKQSAASDCDTASTASMEQLSSDDSSCNTPNKTLFKNSNRSTTSTRCQRRKRSKNKSSKSKCPTKIVNIVPDISPEEKAQYLALDCEMVGIGPAGFTSRLARVSLVNWDGDVVYDVHVKVQEKVTDYRTFVSGITAEDLESPEAVSFDEAQTAVLELLEDKILVGHGLKNDFNVLGVSLPWYSVRDTAKYEPFMKAVELHEIPANATPLLSAGQAYLPKKLKVLAKDKLGMMIQEEGKPHSPVEDAVAALELYKKHRGKWEKAVSYKMERTRKITMGRAQ